MNDIVNFEEYVSSVLGGKQFKVLESHSPNYFNFKRVPWIRLKIHIGGDEGCSVGYGMFPDL